MILIGEHLSHPPCMYYLIRCLCFYVQFRELSLPLRDLPNITEADAVDPNTVDDDMTTSHVDAYTTLFSIPSRIKRSVKISRRYHLELQTFCASRGLKR